jgi:hypothetical protein
MYHLIEWPDIQDLMDEPGFDENACLANDEVFLEKNTTVSSSAYFVKEEWLNSL